MRGWLMLVVVDMGLLVGAVLSLLTGVASIMRPQQRKQIQDFFVGMETAAAIRSLMPGVHALLLIVSWLPWALFACLMIVFGLEVALPDFALLQADESVPDYVKADVALTLYNSRIWLLMLFGSVIFSLPVLLLLRAHYPFFQLWRWVIEPEQATQIRRRVSIVFRRTSWFYILAGISIQVLFWQSYPDGFVLERHYGNLHITYHGPAQEMPMHVVVLYTLMTMFSVLLMTFVGCGRLWATILEGKRTLSLRLLILFRKTALWRIIERRRGSVAAIVLGITVLLGAVRVYAF